MKMWIRKAALWGAIQRVIVRGLDAGLTEAMTPVAAERVRLVNRFAVRAIVLVPLFGVAVYAGTGSIGMAGVVVAPMVASPAVLALHVARAYSAAAWVFFVLPCAVGVVAGTLAGPGAGFEACATLVVTHALVLFDSRKAAVIAAVTFGALPIVAPYLATYGLGFEPWVEPETRSRILPGIVLLVTHAVLAETVWLRTSYERWEAAADRARRVAEDHATARARLVANLSHELRTPLFGLLGTLEVVSACDLPEDVQQLVRRGDSLGRHLSALVDDVLHLGQLDSHGLELSERPFDVQVLARELRDLYRLRTAGTGVEVRLHIDVTHRMRHGDEVRVRQVLLNLLENARKFTEKGYIRLAVRDADTGIVFEVEDTGRGIPPDRISAIFTAFSQVDPTAKDRIEGAGLGLAICKRLTDAMAGEIAVSSAVGRGTRFRVSLPLLSTQEQADGADDAEIDASPLRILVVEDNAVNQLLLRRMLTSLGHEVAGARSGPEGVEMALTGDWDVVLMDLHMPGMCGFEATRRIRAAGSARADVPIFALTASALSEDRDESERVGMNGYLVKPIDRGGLARALAAPARRATSARQKATPQRPEADSGPAR